MFLLRLDEADEHYLFEIEGLHRCCCGRELALTAVDEDQLRQWFIFVEQPFIATENGFVHRRKIIGPLDRFDDKTAGIRACPLAGLRKNEATDIFRT